MTSILRSPITRLIGKRVLGAIPILLGVTFLVSLLLNFLPGDTVQQLLGTNTSPALVHDLTVKLGLNHPFLQRYFHWLWSAVRGNFGTSLVNGVSVAHQLGQRVPVTAEVGLVAFVESWVFSVPIALLAALKPRAFLDRFSIMVSMLGLSTPQFVLALVGVWIFAVHLHWVAAIGFVPVGQGLLKNLHSIVLPSSVIGFGLVCGHVRVLRADLVDQMNGEDYVVTARAKGVPEWLVLIRHAFRNSLFNLITLTMLNLGLVLAGAVLIEEIFSLPGVGLLLLQSIQLRDVTTVQAVVTMMACSVVVANLLGDILYGLLDPRTRHAR